MTQNHLSDNSVISTATFPSFSSTGISRQDFFDYADKYFGRSEDYKANDERWNCPVCGGNDFTFSKDSSKLGAGKCWNCDSTIGDAAKALGGEAQLDYIRLLKLKDGEDSSIVTTGHRGSGRNRRTIDINNLSDKKPVGRPTKDSPIEEVKRMMRSLGCAHADKIPQELVFCEDEKRSVSPRFPVISKTKGEYLAYDHFYSPSQKIQRQEFDQILKTNGKRKKTFYPLIADPSHFLGWSTNGANAADFGIYRLKQLVAATQSNPKANAVFILEGELSCDWFALGTGWCAITLPSVLRNEKGFYALGLTLKKMGVVGVYLPDTDKTGTNKAALAFAGFMAAEAPLVVVSPDKLGMDADDRIKQVFTEQSIEYRSNAMEGHEHQEEIETGFKGFFGNVTKQQQVEALDALYRKSSENHNIDAQHPEVPLTVANAVKIMSRDYAETIKYASDTKSWHVYSDGIWVPLSGDRVDQMVNNLFVQRGAHADITTITKIVSSFRLDMDVLVDAMEHPLHLIGFKNGVLNKKTGEFLPHSPRHGLLWKFPYDCSYPMLPQAPSRAELASYCLPILEWLHRAVGGSQEDLQKVNVMVAYLAAVVRGRTDLQRYLECIGPAGSGKGTFLRLAEAVVGRRNTAATTLPILERNQFEAARLVDASLMLITDADRHIGDCPQLKALTGEDSIRYEIKNVQSQVGQDRSAKGLLIIAGEHSPNSSDSGGLRRRRLTIPFVNPVAAGDRRNLIKTNPQGELEGEFAPYLPAFFSLLLSYEHEEITNLVLRAESYSPTIKSASFEATLSNTPLARWLEKCCYYEIDPINDRSFEVSTQVGLAAKENGKWKNADIHLYANYKKWCEETQSFPIGLNVFSETLTDLMNNQLKLPIRTARVGKNQNVHVIGLGLRVEDAINPYPRIVSEVACNGLEKKDEKEKGGSAIAFPLEEASAIALKREELALSDDTCGGTSGNCHETQTPATVELWVLGELSQSQTEKNKKLKKQPDFLFSSPEAPQTAQSVQSTQSSTAEPTSASKGDRSTPPKAKKAPAASNKKKEQKPQTPRAISSSSCAPPAAPAAPASVNPPAFPSDPANTLNPPASSSSSSAFVDSSDFLLAHDGENCYYFEEGELKE